MNENPYQSPRSGDLAGAPSLLSRGLSLRIARTLALGVAGFGSCHLVAWFVHPELRWWVGLFFSLLFMLSEMFDVPGYALSVILRLGWTFAVFVATGLASGVLSYQLGLFEGRTYTSDPYADFRAALFLCAFAPSMFLARRLLVLRGAFEGADNSANS